MHRDIKPSNIFLKFENDKCITKLGDFGISRYYLDSSELFGNSFYDLYDMELSGNMGTPLFMAPEILKEGHYNYKIDLYSLGVTLYYLIFDEYPYNGKHEFQILNQISIEPFEDCCTIFVPKHPVINPDVRLCEEYESNVDYDALVKKAVETSTVIKVENNTNSQIKEDFKVLF